MSSAPVEGVKKATATVFLFFSGTVAIALVCILLYLVVASLDWIPDGHVGEDTDTPAAQATPTATPDTRPTFPQGTQCVSTCPTTPAPTPVVTAAPTLPPSVATTSPVLDAAVLPYVDANGDKAVHFTVCDGAESPWLDAGYSVACDTVINK